jgi:hypothetical protein
MRHYHHFTWALGLVPVIPAPTRSSIPLVFSPATAASLLDEVVDIPVSAQPLSSQIAATSITNIDKYFMSDAKRIRLRPFRHQNRDTRWFAAIGQLPYLLR